MFRTLFSCCAALVMTLGTLALTAAEVDKASVYLTSIMMPAKYCVLTAEVGGVLDQICVEEVDHVDQQKLLLIIDDRLAHASAEASKAEADRTASVDRAKIQLHDTQLRLNRIFKAFEQSASSKIEVEKAKRNVQLAENQLQAELELRSLNLARYNLAKEQLNRHRITAPFEGSVVTIHQREGTAVKTGMPLVTVACFKHLEADFHFPVDIASSLFVGDEYELQAQAPVNRLVKARLKTRSSMIEPATQTIRCVFHVDNIDQSLPAGFNVNWATDTDQTRKLPIKGETQIRRDSLTVTTKP